MTADELMLVLDAFRVGDRGHAFNAGNVCFAMGDFYSAVNAMVESMTYGTNISDGGVLYFTRIRYADPKNGVFE